LRRELKMSKDFIKDIVPGDYKTRGSYSPAKKIDLGDYYLIFVSGVQAPKNEDHSVVTDDIEEQTKLVFEDIKMILGQADASIDDVVKAVIYITDMNDFDKISKIRGEYFKNAMPVSTMIEASRMTRDGAKIEIEVTAVLKK
jgi:2-iminobutanoate/2-iminopropanoate deaminase